jgi:outer membrane protein assembly factor BamB
MNNASEPIYIGIHGHVLAVDRATGSEVWRTHLAGSSYVTILRDGGGLYAGAMGKLYCLDRVTGSILWKNGLAGLGYSLITFAGSDATAAISQQAAQRQAAAASSSS